ncbi:MAG: phosphotransferase [Egibacteraceae bacterium]
MAGLAWLDANLPSLLAASARAVLAGDALLHGGVRSDNVCLRADRTVLVDWNWACRGNPAFDLVAWAPSLRLEGGPPPEWVAGGELELAALVAGYFAAKAGLPPPHRGSAARDVQHRQLRVALPWACQELGLPPPR